MTLAQCVSKNSRDPKTFSTHRQVATFLLPHRNKARFRFHPLDPRANLRKIIQRKSAFVRDVRVGEQRDVGDAVVLDEDILLGEMLLHVTADGRVGEDAVHLPAVIKRDTLRKASFSSV
jgi:hypothetical protein